MLKGFEDFKEKAGAAPTLQLAAFKESFREYLSAHTKTGRQGIYDSYAQYARTMNLLSACIIGDAYTADILMQELGYHANSQVEVKKDWLPYNPYAPAVMQTFDYEGPKPLVDVLMNSGDRARRVAEIIKRDFPVPRVAISEVPELDLRPFGSDDIAYLSAQDKDGSQDRYTSFAHYATTVNLLSACIQGDVGKVGELMEKLGLNAGSEIKIRFGGVPHNPYAPIGMQSFDVKGPTPLIDIIRENYKKNGGPVADHIEANYPAPDGKKKAKMIM